MPLVPQDGPAAEKGMVSEIQKKPVVREFLAPTQTRRVSTELTWNRAKQLAHAQTQTLDRRTRQHQRRGLQRDRDGRRHDDTRRARGGGGWRKTLRTLPRRTVWEQTDLRQRWLPEGRVPPVLPGLRRG